MSDNIEVNKITPKNKDPENEIENLLKRIEDLVNENKGLTQDKQDAASELKTLRASVQKWTNEAAALSEKVFKLENKPTTNANSDLLAKAILALKAQETLSQWQKQDGYPDYNDPVAVELIGEWNGMEEQHVWYKRFADARRDLRRSVIEEASN